MATFIKQDENGNNGKKKKQSKSVEEATPKDLLAAKSGLATSEADHYRLGFGHSGCIEEALDGLRSVISKWVTQERNGDNASGLYSNPDAYPVRVQLNDPVTVTLGNNDYDDTMDRLVTAFERIADSVARLAGLSRPRLETWHEQDEYTPRHKESACDGGAPGPKAAGKEL